MEKKETRRANKKDLILAEGKRLFGNYGYLGFTLKQLAQACDMTAPALYYFYTSKADLFKDCLLQEIELRYQVIQKCVNESTTVQEFVHAVVIGMLDVCSLSKFRVGQGMAEVIHLPAEMQEELHAAWNRYLIAPTEDFLARTLPDESPLVSRQLLATFFISVLTFAAAKEGEFPREELIALGDTIAIYLLHVSRPLPV